jgi:hypothetical protein
MHTEAVPQPEPTGILRWLRRGENAAINLVLGVMISLPILEGVLRLVRGEGIGGSASIVQHLTLWAAFLGALLCTRERAHLGLSTAELIPEGAPRHAAQVFQYTVSAGVTAVLAYASFELEWEWKVAEGGNNGIKYWLNNFGKPDKPNWLGVEYQMIDDVKHPDATHGDNRNTASIYDIKGAAKDKVVKPAGEWNRSRIVFTKQKTEYYLNGKLTVSFVPWSDDWTKRRNSGKWEAFPDYGKARSGLISFQDHGSNIWFTSPRDGTVSKIPV